MKLSSQASTILETVAETLATAVTGPFAPLADAAIHAVFGTKDAAGASAAIVGATADQLLALKKAGNDFAVQMETLGVQKEQLAYADVASARAMQTTTRDPTVDRLAWLIIGGFLVISIAQLVGLMGFAEQVSKIPPQGWLLIGNLSGYLANEAKQAAAFYFGTTASGQAKDATIADIAKS